MSLVTALPAPAARFIPLELQDDLGFEFEFCVFDGTGRAGFVLAAQSRGEDVSQFVVARIRVGLQGLLLRPEESDPVVEFAFEDVGIGHAAADEELPGLGGGRFAVAHHHEDRVGGRFAEQERDDFTQPFQRHIDRAFDVVQVVLRFGSHIEVDGIHDLVVLCLEGFGGGDVNQPLFEHFVSRVGVGVDNRVGVQLRDGLGAGELDLGVFLFHRGGADQHHADGGGEQNACAHHADFRFLAQILLAENAFELLRAPKHEERHHDDQHNHHADRDAEDLVEGQASVVARVVVPVGEERFGLGEERRAEETAEHEEHSVDLACGCGRKRGGGAEPADDEADAHDEFAEDARPDVGGVDPDLAEIEDAESDSAEGQDHRGDDGGEHDLEHGQLGEVELRGELARVAEARHFKCEAEGKADQREDEIGPRVGGADGCEGGMGKFI